MASENILNRFTASAGWLAATILTAWGGGVSFAMGRIWWCALAVMAGVACAFMSVRHIVRVGKRVGYVMEATMNGDFSYKFPTDKVSRHERDTNRLLNRMVEHLERLTSEIRQKEHFLTRIINMTDIGMVVADSSGNVRIHNKSALRLLDRPALTHICQISQQDSSGLSIVKTDVALNGEQMHVYTINDLRRPLQAAEVESWEKLTRVLTHEIMNSLTPIHSMAETMKGEAAEEDAREAFDTISSSSGSLMTFVKNFRKFSILPELQMRVVYMKPLLEKCVRMAGEYAGRVGVRIQLTCFPPDMMVYTDEALLSRVVINILKNAVEASPSSITVEANVASDESVEIRISNDGELIAEENAEQIFTPFFTTRASGSGIGLSLSRRIVSHLGGTLTLKTRPHTCFVVRI